VAVAPAIEGPTVRGLSVGANEIRALGPTAADNAFGIVLFSYSGVSVPARNNNSTERDQRFESGFLQYSTESTTNPCARDPRL
jgi:hypothetical protein